VGPILIMTIEIRRTLGVWGEVTWTVPRYGRPQQQLVFTPETLSYSTISIFLRGLFALQIPSHASKTICATIDETEVFF
jgi:hypothetical protein